MFLHSKGLTRIVAASLLLIVTPAISAANLQVAGLAVYTDTARDIYIAGLLTSSGMPPASAASVSAPAAMEYRIATRRISDRGLSGTILLQAELGAGSRAPTDVVDGLAQLKQQLKGALRSGDQFRIALSEAGDTVFSLNGIQLLNLSGSAVFDYLLNGWIGDSASALIRDKLLSGEFDDDVMLRYESLIPLEERKQLVAGWADGAAASPEPAPQAEPSVAQTEPEPQDEPEPESEAVAQAAEPAAAEPASAEPASAEPESPAGSPVAEDVAAGAMVAAATQVPLPTSSEPSLEEAAETEQLAMVQLSPAPALDERSPEEIWLDSLDDREYQQKLNEYIASVMIKVFKTVRYPKRAVKREWEGQVEVLAEVDSAGDIRNISLETSSGRDILDEAAMDAVKDSAPFPELTSVAKAEFMADKGSDTYFMMIPVKFLLN